MARKRHLASSARGLLCFCLASTTELIRLIRGRKETSIGQVFILVYRLAIDAKTRKGDDGAG